MNENLDPNNQPLLAHLLELRKRLIICLLSLAVGCVIGYILAPHTYNILVKPLAELTAGETRKLIYTGLAEAFVTYLKLALWTGFALSLPIMLGQLWGFIAPGMYKHEKNATAPFFIFSPALFIIGAVFAWYLVLPMAWKFFLSFETPTNVGGLPIKLEARVSEYLSLATGIIASFGIAFQMPIFLILMVRAHILSAAQLASGRRLAIVLIFVFAAIITPPDVISQICLAVPLLVLYEVAIIVAKWIEKNRTKTAE